MNKFLKLSGLIVFISLVFLSLVSCDWLFTDQETTKNTTLSGTVSLTGDTRPGESLTATARLNATTGLSYQWKRTNSTGKSTNISGVNTRTYKIHEDDVNSDISVTVTCSGYTGSVESNSLIIRAGEDLSGTYHDSEELLPSLIFTDYTVIKIWDSNDPEQIIVESEGTYEANNDILTLILKDKLGSLSEYKEIYQYERYNNTLLLTQGSDTWVFVKDDRAENAIIIDLEAMNEWELLDQRREVNAGQNSTFTVTGTGSYIEYKWYLNGDLVPSVTGISYVFNQMATGTYELVVVVKNDQGQSRSQRCWITVK